MEVKRSHSEEAAQLKTGFLNTFNKETTGLVHEQKMWIEVETVGGNSFYTIHPTKYFKEAKMYSKKTKKKIKQKIKMIHTQKTTKSPGSLCKNIKNSS